MESERLDCTWCGSARSIEYGICQVCLMEFPLETKVIHLPIEPKRHDRTRRIELPEEDVKLAE